MAWVTVTARSKERMDDFGAYYTKDEIRVTYSALDLSDHAWIVTEPPDESWRARLRRFVACSIDRHSFESTNIPHTYTCRDCGLTLAGHP